MVRWRLQAEVAIQDLLVVFMVTEPLLIQGSDVMDCDTNTTQCVACPGEGVRLTCPLQYVVYAQALAGFRMTNGDKQICEELPEDCMSPSSDLNRVRTTCLWAHNTCTFTVGSNAVPLNYEDCFPTHITPSYVVINDIRCIRRDKIHWMTFGTPHKIACGPGESGYILSPHHPVTYHQNYAIGHQAVMSFEVSNNYTVSIEIVELDLPRTNPYTGACNTIYDYLEISTSYKTSPICGSLIGSKPNVYHNVVSLRLHAKQLNHHTGFVIRYKVEKAEFLQDEVATVATAKPVSGVATNVTSLPGGVRATTAPQRPFTVVYILGALFIVLLLCSTCALVIIVQRTKHNGRCMRHPSRNVSTPSRDIELALNNAKQLDFEANIIQNADHINSGEKCYSYEPLLPNVSDNFRQEGKAI